MLESLSLLTSSRGLKTDNDRVIGLQTIRTNRSGAGSNKDLLRVGYVLNIPNVDRSGRVPRMRCR
jgi:hypothetical protein